jgi:hypothetical protein
MNKKPEAKAVTGERIPAREIQVGDVIMPPERELSLWMRKHVADKGLGEEALHLKVTQVREGKPDKRGRWLVFKTEHTSALAFNLFPFSFKARPETPWVIIQKASAPEKRDYTPTPEAIAADKAALANYKATHAAALPDEEEEVTGEGNEPRTTPAFQAEMQRIADNVELPVEAIYSAWKRYTADSETSKYIVEFERLYFPAGKVSADSPIAAPETRDLGETVTVLKSDYEGLQGICRHYHEALKKAESERDELLAAAKAVFEPTGKPVSVSQFSRDYDRLRAAIAKVEGQS